MERESDTSRTSTPSLDTPTASGDDVATSPRIQAPPCDTQALPATPTPAPDASPSSAPRATVAAVEGSPPPASNQKDRACEDEEHNRGNMASEIEKSCLGRPAVQVDAVPATAAAVAAPDSPEQENDRSVGEGPVAVSSSAGERDDIAGSSGIVTPRSQDNLSAVPRHLDLAVDEHHTGNIAAAAPSTARNEGTDLIAVPSRLEIVLDSLGDSSPRTLSREPGRPESKASPHSSARPNSARSMGSHGSSRSSSSRRSVSRRKRLEQQGTMSAVFAVARLQALSAKDTFECPLCLCNESVELAYVVEPCGHQMCKSCLGEFVVNEIDDGNVLVLRCPGDEDDRQPCGSSLSSDVVEQLVDRDTFAKYQRFVALRSDTLLRACPTPRCAALNRVVPPSPAITCKTCQTVYCYFHSGAHPNRTCKDYRRQRGKEAKKNDEFVRLHTVHCPNPKCGLPVTKSTGCNHMTCSRCRQDFCYLCGSVIGDVSAHYAKLNILGCPGLHFSRHDANARRRGAACRLCLLPCAVFTVSLLLLPFLLLCGAVWLALLVGLCICWVPYVYMQYKRFGGHLSDEVRTWVPAAW